MDQFENPEQSEPSDISGEDTQMRFHYQAQRIACLAVSLISSPRAATSIYCEQHEDCLLKRVDKLFVVYQYKTRNLSLDAFRATDKQILQTVKNFTNHHKRFGDRVAEYVIATNHTFQASHDKYDLRYLTDLASTEPANALLNDYVQQVVAFSKGELNFGDIVEVLKKTRLQNREPDFSQATHAVIKALSQVPELVDLNETSLKRCAHALVAKVEDSSRKYISPDTEVQPEDKRIAQNIFKKRLTPQIVWTVLESVAGNPLGTAIQRIAVEYVPDRSVPFVKMAFAASGESLQASTRTLRDGSRFNRKELKRLIKFVSEPTSCQTCLVIGEPGSGKTALLADLVDELTLSGQTVLTLKSIDVPKEIKNQEELAAFWGLPYGAETCVRTLARTQRVTIVIDQLDAIGMLWDTQTARMQMVLPVVYACSKLNNVRVVLSCREFDAHYDQRIANLKATVINLELPSGVEVQKILKAHGVDSSAWPNDVQEMLRNPQHLDIFVGLLQDAADEVKAIKSYFDLLNLLWSKRVQPGDESLLSKLCDFISDRKQFSVPVSLFDHERVTLDRLIGAGLLKLSDNANKIEFAHQTLYEFSIARTFVQGNKSLSDFVFKHQNSLHIRPLMWSCLIYLRNCDQATYEKELAELFAQDLRAHVKALILQFLSQVQKPSQIEINCVLPKAIQGEFSDEDLIRLAQNLDWFDMLDTTYLPLLMQDDSRCEIAAVMLGNACNWRQQKVVSRLKAKWFNLPKRDGPALMVLKKIKNWDDSLTSNLCTIIERNNFDRTYLEFLLVDLSKCAPQFVARAVKSWLSQQYAQATKHPKIDFKPPSEMSAMNQYFWAWRQKHNDPRLKSISEIIDGKNRYSLPEIAERNASDFIKQVWPLFRQMLDELTDEPNDTHSMYSRDKAHYTSQSRESLDKAKNSLVSIFAIQITTFASTEMSQFERFVSVNSDSHNLYVHRLICWGLCELVHKCPTFVFDYLLGDDRRLTLGTHGEPHVDTAALIKLLSPHLAPEQLSQLEKRIMDWQMYVSQTVLDDNQRRAQWQRQHRLQLLVAIPEHLRSNELKELVIAECAALPNYDEPLISEPKIQTAASPMSSKLMAEQPLSDVQALFEEPPHIDEQEPEIWQQGKSQALWQELQRLAQSNSGKALEIAYSFVPDKNDDAVAHVLAGLTRNDTVPVAVIEATIRDFVIRGFNSQTFAVAVADFVDHRLSWTKIPLKISDDILSILESAILALPQTPIVVHSESRQPSGSLCWSMTPFLTLPTDGLYPLLSAFTRGLYASEEPNVNRWLDLLRFAIPLRRDSWAWEAFSLSTGLARLLEVDYALAREVLNLLFEHQPEVLRSKAGAILLCNVMSVVEPQAMDSLIQTIADGPWEQREQACGEIAALDYFVSRNPWSRELVEAVLQLNDSKKEFLLGLAYTTGIAWNNPTYRGEAKLIIQKLIVLTDTALLKAVASTMDLTGELLPDKDTLWLIDVLCAQPNLFRLGFAQRLNGVGNLILFDPDRACKFLNAFAREFGTDFSDLRTTLPMFSKPVVSATLTLQKIPGYEKRALELFEYLLALNMREALEVVKEIDRIPKLIHEKTAIEYQ
jgi:hypothetical protein